LAQGNLKKTPAEKCTNFVEVRLIRKDAFTWWLWCHHRYQVRENYEL